MIDLFKVIGQVPDDDLLLVSGCEIPIIAGEIVKTLKIFNNYRDDGLDITSDRYYEYRADISITFGIDLSNGSVNVIHRIMWEQWLHFLSRLDLISVCCDGSGRPSMLFFDDQDIDYLNSVAQPENVKSDKMIVAGKIHRWSGDDYDDCMINCYEVNRVENCTILQQIDTKHNNRAPVAKIIRLSNTFPMDITHCIPIIDDRCKIIENQVYQCIIIFKRSIDMPKRHAELAEKMMLMNPITK